MPFKFRFLFSLNRLERFIFAYGQPKFYFNCLDGTLVFCRSGVLAFSHNSAFQGETPHLFGSFALSSYNTLYRYYCLEISSSRGFTFHRVSTQFQYPLKKNNQKSDRRRCLNLNLNVMYTFR